MNRRRHRHHHIDRYRHRNGSVNRQLRRQFADHHAAADMRGAQAGHHHPRCTRVANRRRQSQNDCLAHLIWRTAAQFGKCRRRGRCPSAKTFHVATGGRFTHPEYCADFQHDCGNAGHLFTVVAKFILHSPDKAGIGAGIACSGARLQADRMISDLRAQGIGQHLVEK